MATAPKLPLSADGDRSEDKGTTISGKQDSAKVVAETNKLIEARQSNPLSIFSSYTYQITLYMISPGAYNAFVQTGRTNINAIGQAQTISSQNANQNNGVFIVAQSGGVNKTENRAPYLDLDYYIDDLKIKSAISAQANRSATNTTEMNFKIIEPYGFSFITQLKFAANTLKKTKSAIPGMQNQNNPIQHFFVLGIRFIGYDELGNVMTPNKALNNTIDYVSPTAELYEHFYDIQITKLDFKLDGRATTYNIEARTTTTNVGLGIKYGRVDNNIEIQATNVKDALTELGNKLTTISKRAEINNTYKITFLGEGVDKLEQAEFYSEADLSKIKSAMTAAKTSKDVNELTSLVNLPKLKTRQFKLKNDSSILQTIDDIISQSDYLANALSVIYKANLQANQEKANDAQINKDEKQDVTWYNVSVNVIVGKYDDTREDYTYDIEYIIQPYKTPVIRSAYVPKTTKYYGPHKRYNYYFTGENSEIIEYSQTYNNTFFTVQAQKDISPEGQKNATQGQSPVVTNKQQNQSSPGDPDIGRETVNAVRSSLYDPGSTIATKITILGDPDFLILPTISNVSRIYNQFYGPNYSINANSGQVFIEISFKEAIDYDNNGRTGLLDVNDKIYFWNYPKDIRQKIQGIVYQVHTVVSTFSRGRFTQLLDCIMPGFSVAGEGTIEDGKTAISANTSTTTVNTPPVSPKPAPEPTNITPNNARTVPNTPQTTTPATAPTAGATTTQRPPDPVADEEGGINGLRFGTF